MAQNPYVKPYVKSMDSGFDVPYATFDEYSEQFKDIFTMKRENGIIEVLMHTDGGDAIWHHGMHKGWSQVLYYIGQDPENEVVILGGTGDYFIKGVNMEAGQIAAEMIAQGKAEEVRRHQIEFVYDTEWIDGRALVHAVTDYLNVPTIGVYNGPSTGLSCIATLCDLTICAEDAIFNEVHFNADMVPGDGHFLSFQMLAGTKRASYMAYTAQNVDAQTAKEWGMVNEVLPKDQLLPRAWELARQIMTKSRYTRRWMHDIAVKPYREQVQKDLELQFSLEIASQLMNSSLNQKDYNKAIQEHITDYVQDSYEEGEAPAEA